MYSNQMLRVVQNREEFYIYHFMSNMGLSFFGVVVVGCDCFFIVTRRPDGPVFFCRLSGGCRVFTRHLSAKDVPTKRKEIFVPLKSKQKENGKKKKAELPQFVSAKGLSHENHLVSKRNLNWRDVFLKH